MPRLSEFYGIEIAIRYSEARHERAHFHAKYAEFICSIAIDNLAVLAGDLPRRALELTLAWAAMHREELLAAWDAAKRGEKPAKIAPLE